MQSDRDATCPWRNSGRRPTEGFIRAFRPATFRARADEPLGTDEETGKSIYVKVGPYGPYVVHKKDYRSLKDEDDVLTVDFDRAMELLSQPKRGRRGREPLREIGPHPDDGAPIKLFDGRYGPYVKHGKVNASLPRGAKPEEVTLEQAVELIAERAEKLANKKGKRRKGARRK